ncbi:TldD/PmbA family protein [bacterium]|nr:TldD/PmbA family protein [bacterium]
MPEVFSLSIDEVLRSLLDDALVKGAQYGDIRYGKYRSQTVSVRDHLVESIEDDASEGVGIRVLVDGGWGFASTPDLSPDVLNATLLRAIEVAKASASLRPEPVSWPDLPPQVGRFETPVKEDPFTVPIQERIEMLLATTEACLSQEGCFRATAETFCGEENRRFFSTQGCDITQKVVRLSPDLMAWGKGRDGKVRTRGYQVPPLTIGYEHIRQADLPGNGARVGREAVERANAPQGPSGKLDLVLDPAHLALTIHESIGHATELDRACGWEADFAGTSFLKTSDIDTLQYGSKWVNVQGDRTLPHGQSTLGWDDDGVPVTEFKIIEEGVFRGFSSTRDSAYLQGEEGAGRACGHADSWANTPILRIPNVWLKPTPGPQAPTKDDLVASVKRGVLIQGRGSFSIDQQRFNFQFGGDAFWEIRDGKVRGMYSDVTYRSITTQFWNACDGVAGEDDWLPHGVRNCGKGQPSQQGQQTHGASWSVFRGIQVGDAN